MRGSGRALPLGLVPPMATRPETEARLYARPYLFCDEQVALAWSARNHVLSSHESRPAERAVRRFALGTPAEPARTTFCR